MKNVESLLTSGAAKLCEQDDRYAVTNTGLVFSRAKYGGGKGGRKRYAEKWREVKPRRGTYPSVCLGAGVSRHIHELVALAFLGPRPHGCQIRHLDGDPTNNTLANLRYGTPKENGADKVAHGRSLRGGKQHLNKLSENDAKNVRLLAQARCLPQRDLAFIFGITQASVRDIMTGRSWGWMP